MLIAISKREAMRLYKDGEKVFCNGKQITPWYVQSVLRMDRQAGLGSEICQEE